MGPSEAELAHEKAGFAEAYNDPRWPAHEAATAATSALFDIPLGDPTTRLQEVEAVTPEDVARRFAEALPTALVAVPPDVTLSLPGVEEGGCPRTRTVPRGQEYSMKLWVRLLSRQLRAPRLYLTSSGLARRDPDGDVHETAFADVIGVDCDGDNRLVFAVNSCVFPIVPDAYRGGHDIVDAIDRNVPGHVRYSSTGEAPRRTSPMDVLSRLGRKRPWWYRLLNGAAAVMFALATVVLFLNWYWNDGALWWGILGAAVTGWFAWDARPPRRRKPLAP